MKAVSLRPAAWDQLLDAGGDIADAMTGLLAANEVACRNSNLPVERVDELTGHAPEWIPGWVVTLHNHRLATYKPALPPAQTPIQMPVTARKVGRNDPCPCGSGKKYKKCCGLN